MSNSSLVNYTRLSPNHSGKRTHAIDRISPHCVVGQCSVETLGSIFAPTSRQASCNYGIGSDGRVGLYVDEGNRSWCTSSNANDQRAVTIECASDTTHPYTMNSAVYNKLIDLCVDICKRNGKKKLLWFSNPTTALNYAPKSDEMVITVHRWFANKSCPGDWLFSRLGNVASEVTKRLGGSSTSTSTGAQNGAYESYSGYVEVIYNGLSIRSKASWDDSAVCGTVKKGEVFTVVGRQLVGGVYLYKLKSGKWITSAKEYVSYRTTLHGSTSSTQSNPLKDADGYYKVGTLVCTNTLATSSTGGKVYKGDWKGTITRVIKGVAYPYLLNNGTGWTNDTGIDTDPHTP